jgi:hypothetical protein
MDITTNALAALAPLHVAERAEQRELLDAVAGDANVWGVHVQPRTDGRSVVASWIEGGFDRMVTGEPHAVGLDTMRAAFERAGWRVELGIWHIRAFAPEGGAAPVWGEQQLTLAGAATDAQQGALF